MKIKLKAEKKTKWHWTAFPLNSDPWEYVGLKCQTKTNETQTYLFAI